MLIERKAIRSPLGIAVIGALTIAATGAGASTIHRLTVTESSGSGSLGATSFFQNGASSSALQGEVGTGSPNTHIHIPFGVLGEYDATGSTFGIGVAGISSTGYAVGAEAFGGQPSLLALGTTTNDAIEAAETATSGDAVYAAASGTNADGVYGTATAAAGSGVVGVASGGPNGSGDGGDGVAGINTSNGGIGTGGFDESQSGTGVFGTSVGGSGGIFQSSTGIGLLGISDSSHTSSPAVQAMTSTEGTDLYNAIVKGTDSNFYQPFRMGYPSLYKSFGSVNHSVGGDADIFLNGDMYLTGQVYANCQDGYTGCQQYAAQMSTVRTGRGTDVATYPSHHALPTVEDEGEAQLVNGYAHVTIDATLASTMSADKPYLVFTTPQGDSRGLYITHRSPTGFDVRENGGGRSTMTFDYRIVGRPYGDNSTRLATVAHTPKTGTAFRVRALPATQLHRKAMAAGHRFPAIPKSLGDAPAVRSR